MKIDHRVVMTFRQILLMNFGFFGIQYSFGLQQTAINPVFSMLNANPDQLPLLNLAGPVTGLIIQPLIGAISDRTWIPGMGRRRPFFLIGAIGCSICLFLYPHVTELWMAVLLLWLLDASNNTAMEPYRAFIADKLPDEQHATGFLMQSFFAGLGITLANVSLYFFQRYFTAVTDEGMPVWVYGSFYVGAFCSIATVLISVLTTPEIEPTPEELAEIRAKPHGLVAAVKEIYEAILVMPKTLWQLGAVYMFQWYAMFVYWQFVSHSIADSAFGRLEAATPKEAAHLYEQAVAWTGLVNGFYNVVTFLSAFVLMYLARKYQAKLVPAFALALMSLGLCLSPHITNKFMLFLPMIGFGIGWASMLGVPYMIAVAEIPSGRYGVYMGIINMMIVIPMLLQTVSFGWIYRTVLDHNPGYAMTFAGVLLLLACITTLFVSTPHMPRRDNFPMQNRTKKQG